MKTQLKEIYIVENLGGIALAVCLSKREALDARTYFTRCIGYTRKSIVIREAYAYQNGWHRDMLESYKKSKEKGAIL